MCVVACFPELVRQRLPLLVLVPRTKLFSMSSQRMCPNRVQFPLRDTRVSVSHIPPNASAIQLSYRGTMSSFLEHSTAFGLW
jgi:hypothetical protein